MFRFVRNGALATALMGVGFMPTLTLGSPSAPVTPASYKPEQVIVLKEAGKPDRRCVVLSSKKSADGTTSYQIKALDNGEIMTIHDRVPKDVAQKLQSIQPAPNGKVTPAKPGPGSNSMEGVTLPPDIIGKTDSNLPKAQDRAEDPLLKPLVPSTPPTMPTVTQAVPARRAPAPEKPSKPGLFQTIFGKSTPTAAPCNTCKQTQPLVSPAPCVTCKQPEPAPCATMPGRAMVGAVKTPEPPVAGVQGDPVPLELSPQLPLTLPLQRPLPSEPVSLPIHETPLDPTQQAVRSEHQRIEALKEKLKNEERPSFRMTAAEELSTAARGQSSDVRALLMLSAQDDPAGCVRAACINCLSKQGVRDQAFLTLLVAAQNDKDATVREEAEYALKKVAKR